MTGGIKVLEDDENLIQKLQSKQEELANPDSEQDKVRLAEEIEVLKIQIENVDMETYKFKDEPDEIVKSPQIAIDVEAIRFSYIDGQGVNLFFDDLFSGVRIEHWQAEVMRAIKKAYDECVSIEQK